MSQVEALAISEIMGYSFMHLTFHGLFIHLLFIKVALFKKNQIQVDIQKDLLGLEFGSCLGSTHFRSTITILISGSIRLWTEEWRMVKVELFPWKGYQCAASMTGSTYICFSQRQRNILCRTDCVFWALHPGDATIYPRLKRRLLDIATKCSYSSSVR